MATILPLIGACATTPTPDMVGNDIVYVAREWSEHTDGRLYGGVINPTQRLSGELGFYAGCLAETRSKTLIVLTGAMDFHQPDAHAAKPHVYSRSIAGDQPATIIAVGDNFVVQGTPVSALPEGVRLERDIPAACADMQIFMLTSQTFRQG